VDVALFYSGLIATCAGAFSLLRPLRWLGIPSRAAAASVVGAGVGLMLVGLFVVGYGLKRGQGAPSRIDEFLPQYHFSEFHEARVQAPPERVWRAIEDVRASEIRFFLLLTTLRGLGHRRAGIDPRAEPPLLALARRGGFFDLAAEPPRELVLGTVGQFWQVRRGRHADVRDSEAFMAFDRPGFAKAAIDFRVIDEGAGVTRVTTETRILATDSGAHRRFGLYWRIIYPGSALIRREWLRAIARRAEAGP
jgi:hypothetical protein